MDDDYQVINPNDKPVMYHYWRHGIRFPLEVPAYWPVLDMGDGSVMITLPDGTGVRGE